jgi:hypothetical protein
LLFQQTLLLSLIGSGFAAPHLPPHLLLLPLLLLLL